MKNKKLRSSKNRRTGLILIAILALSLGTVYFLVDRSQKSSDISMSPEGNSAQSSGQDSAAKQEFIESNKSGGSTTQDQSSGGQATKSLELSAQDSGNGTITVFTKLYGYSSGTCNLTSSNSGRLDKQQADVIFERAFSSCAGFSVSKNYLGPGVWKITLLLDSEGTVDSKEIILEVK